MSERSCMKSLLEFAVIDPEVMGGVPVFSGSRVPVATLFENLADGLSLNEILDDFPSIGRTSAICALRFAQNSIEQRLRDSTD